MMCWRFKADAQLKCVQKKFANANVNAGMVEKTDLKVQQTTRSLGLPNNPDFSAVDS